MRALNLDFRRGIHSPGWVGIALLIAALAGALASGGHYLQLADRIAVADASIRDAAATTRKAARSASANVDPQTLASELQRAREILLALTLPWGDLFASAESSGTPDVALLSIESDTDKRRVRISGEAKNFEAMLGYLRYLEARPTLVDVYLQSHELQKQDPQQPMRFVLNAEWRGSK